MSRNVDFFFFVEHRDRELATVRHLAEHLHHAYGARSLIASLYFHLHLLDRHRAGTYVYPYAIKATDYPVDEVLARFGERVAHMNLNFEQLLTRSNLAYKRPRDRFARETLRHVSWQAPFRDYLIESGVLPRSIRVTGNPATDLLLAAEGEAEAMRVRLSGEFGLDASRPWLFLPMNYAWAFSSDRLIENKIANGYDPAAAWEYRTYSQRCLRRFLHFVDDITALAEYELVLRPHPTITEDDYRAAFRRELGRVPAGLVITKRHTIREWIVAADRIGSSWSTAAWDAFNIGKPAFLFHPEPWPDFLYVWWYEAMPRIADAAELAGVTAGERTYRPGEAVRNVADFLWEQRGEGVAARRRGSRMAAKVWLKQWLFRHGGALGRRAVAPGERYDYFEPLQVG